MVEIKTLLENHLSQNLALKAEHGLCLYIEKDGRSILFDCGSNASALYNAEKMGIDLKKVDYVVLSHSHYDHAGGYKELVKDGCKSPLYIGTHFFEDKYAVDSNNYTYLGCGFNEKFIKDNEITFTICNDIKKLFGGCYIVGGFEKTYGFETPHRRFVKKRNNVFIEDNFEDEICLVIEDNDELVVIVGCSHPGILNILSTIKKRFKKPIKAVVGGTHLVEADEERIKLTYKAIKNMEIEHLGFNHCTGEYACQHVIKDELGIKLTHLKTGDCYISQ